MSSPTKYHICDDCGMQFCYSCRQEITCPGCGHWDNPGNDCTCGECQHEGTIQAAARNCQAIVYFVNSCLNYQPETIVFLLSKQGT